jgi:hypothetical protein
MIKAQFDIVNSLQNFVELTPLQINHPSVLDCSLPQMEIGCLPPGKRFPKVLAPQAFFFRPQS